MGKKGSWFSAVKKALSYDSKGKRDKKIRKSRRWFSKQSSPDVDSPSAENVQVIPPQRSPVEDLKLIGAENEQHMHAYSVALATAAAAEAAVAAAQAAAEVVRLTTAARYSGKTREEIAAIKIQTAFRGYLARRALRALRGLVRLKSLINGQSIRRQATSTLRCMQTMSRVQAEIRARRIRMSEENTALRIQLEQKHEKDLEKSSPIIEENWDDSTWTRKQIEADRLHKQEAAMRRERTLAYAYTHQQRRNNQKTTSQTVIDPNMPRWGWSWLERWMAARPWENEAPIDKELNNDHASPKSTESHTISTGGSTKAHPRRVLPLNTKDSPTLSKQSRPPSRLSLSTPTSKVGRSRPPSVKGNAGAHDDTRSVNSTQSEHYRRHSAAGSSIRDDESLASSPAVPSYMAQTKATKARSRMPSPSASEKQTTPEKGSLNSAKKRLSFSPSHGGPRRHSTPAKMDSKLPKENNTNL